jgi:hypothetical protein
VTAGDVGHLVSAGELLGRPASQIADRHDAHDLAAVDHRQVTDVPRDHVLGRVGEVHLRPHRLEISPGHAVGNLHGMRVPPGRHQVHDVAFGHDAGELLAVEHHDRGDAVRAHRLGDVGEGVFALGRLHIGVHHVADLHRCAPPSRKPEPGRSLPLRAGSPSVVADS